MNNKLNIDGYIIDPSKRMTSFTNVLSKQFVVVANSNNHGYPMNTILTFTNIGKYENDKREIYGYNMTHGSKISRGAHCLYAKDCVLIEESMKEVISSADTLNSLKELKNKIFLQHTALEKESANVQSKIDFLTKTGEEIYDEKLHIVFTYIWTTFGLNTTQSLEHAKNILQNLNK